MSQKILAEVQQKLGLLTDEELETIIRTATVLRSKKSVRDSLQPWYSALARILHERVLWEVPPLDVLPVATQQRLEKSQRELMMWLEKAFQPPLTQVQTLWAFNWLARLLAEEMERQNRPLCLTTLLCATGEIPAAVESAFPGYLKMGLLHKVLERFSVKVEDD
jgi:hypothetical protein